MKKIIIYNNDSKGFWHFSMLHKIDSLLRDKYEIFFIIWGRYSQEYLNWKKYLILNWDSENRKLQVENIMCDFSADFMFIDYFPFGRYNFIHEIWGFITIFRKNKGKKVFSIMRDIQHWKEICSNDKIKKYYEIIFEKFSVKKYNITWKISLEIHKFSYENGYENEFMHSFIESILHNWIVDKILVFWDEKIYKLQDEFHLSRWIENQFHSMWYLWMNYDNPTLSVEQKFVLISFWWNVFDEKIFMKLLHITKKITKIPFKIILGTYLDETKKGVIVSRFSNENIEFIDFTIDIKKYLEKTSLFIWSWWYGTVMDIYSYNIPAFLFINANNSVSANFWEQEKRIEIFSHLGDIHFYERIDMKFLKDILEHLGKDNHQYKRNTIHFSKQSDFFKILS